VNILPVIAVLALVATPAYAKKDCNELKSEIEAKVKAKGVKAYTLEIVERGSAKDARVVGNCDGGAKEIVYRRGESK
jgi:Protein of unknown function (DUF1161)